MFTLFPHCITKNILNENIYTCDTLSIINKNYTDVNTYLAHYTVQDIFSFISRKFYYKMYWYLVPLWINDKNIFDDNKLIEYVKSNTHVIVDYVYNKTNNIACNNIQYQNIIDDIIVKYYVIGTHNRICVNKQIIELYNK